MIAAPLAWISSWNVYADPCFDNVYDHCRRGTEFGLIGWVLVFAFMSALFGTVLLNKFAKYNEHKPLLGGSIFAILLLLALLPTLLTNILSVYIWELHALYPLLVVVAALGYALYVVIERSYFQTMRESKK